MDVLQKTRSSVNRLKLTAGAASILFAMLSCSQGYISPVELTATALVRGPSSTAFPTSTMAPATATPETPSPVPTFTDLPKFTSTPQPTRTVDPNATPKPPIQYYTQAGDTLPSILDRFGVTAEQITASQPIPSTGLISPNILLVIPDVLDNVFESTMILPDSEVVYSPSASDFDIEAFVSEAGGYLSRYQELVGSKNYTGGELVKLVAEENSVNPYLLLAVLEYKSRWVYGSPTNIAEAEYPMGMVRLEYKGLYKQLSWAVSQLSLGYYGWRAGILHALTFRDGSQQRISPGLNAGTAAVQFLFSKLYDKLEWSDALYGSNSMPALMERMFGNFYIRAQSVEPLYPPDLKQPVLELPFVPGITWTFTGGPHSAWGTDGALAALDFGPPTGMPGCVTTEQWVPAMASGVIVQAENGRVLEDLDGDGIEQTGWDIMYMHIETRDRVAVGTRVETGDKIGHPSCEGGVSTGTHTHVARKFNGEWILADGPLPFVMSGYTAHNGDVPYEGTMTNGDHVVTADPLASPKADISKPRP
jgi:murein DD-endopeptidase MepM/ murein hydrolase activator NlpD